MTPADVALTTRVGEEGVTWTERRWLVRSRAFAQAQEASLERRLALVCGLADHLEV